MTKKNSTTKVSNQVEAKTKLATTEELGVAPGQIESIDDDMEEPQTKEYNTQGSNQSGSIAVYFKQNFKDALLQTIGNLGYDQMIGTPSKNIRVNQFFETLETVMGKPLTEQQANEFINLVTLAPYNVVSQVMSNIKTNQSLYFDVRQV